MNDEELEDCGIEELYSRGRPPATLPQTVGRDEYSWQLLQKQPYGLAIWDLALVEGVSTVVFLAREPRKEVLQFQQKPDAIWKALSFAFDDINGHRVMPVVIMIFFIPLQTIYEIYFNFYGETGKYVQEAFRLLGQQTTNYLFFHDRGPEPVRKIGFDNNLIDFFHGHYGMMKAMPEWSDADFEEAKRRLMTQYTGQQLWGMK